MEDPALILLAKKPLPGYVKTRIFPEASPETAAAIAMDMIEDTVSNAIISWPGPVKLLVSPNPCHSPLRDMLVNYNVPTGSQSQGDLGEKMESAICEALKTSTAAAVMGCDIPSVSEDLLKFAYHRLVEGANIIGPSADGGFYFAGMQRYVPGMFREIEWSTNTVLQSVMARIRNMGVEFDVMLPCLEDVDTWQDFKKMAIEFPKYGKYL